MEHQKVFIKEGETAEIQCPSCQKNKTVPIEKVPKKFWFVVKCSCGSEFVVQRELRRKFRKNVHLTGEVIRGTADKDSKWGKALNESVEMKSSCMIINISTIGIGIILTGHSELGVIKVGDILQVNFNLDNSAATKIEKRMTVKAVKGNYIGGEFFDDEKEDKDIKFYLL